VQKVKHLQKHSCSAFSVNPWLKYNIFANVKGTTPFLINFNLSKKNFTLGKLKRKIETLRGYFSAVGKLQLRVCPQKI